MPKEAITPSPVEHVLRTAKKAAPDYVRTPQDLGRWALVNYAQVKYEVEINDIEEGVPFTSPQKKDLMEAARSLSSEGVKIDNYGKAMGIVLRYHRETSSVASLDKPVGGDEESMDLGELISDESFRTPEDAIVQSSLKETLSQLIGSVLTSRQARALELMFAQGKSQIEMGIDLGMGRGGARGIKNTAISKLRSEIKRRGLEKELRDHLT